MRGGWGGVLDCGEGEGGVDVDVDVDVDVEGLGCFS